MLQSIKAGDHSAKGGDLRGQIERLERLAVMPATSADGLAANLTELYRAVFDIDLSQTDPVAVRPFAPAAMTRLFDLQMALRDRIPAWHTNGLFSRDAQKAMRDVFRALRIAIDMLGELNIGYDRLGETGTTARGFTGRDMNTLVNPRFETGTDIPFQSGDLLLMRGRHHNSAAIARIGDVDSQFSHVGIIYIDDQGRAFVVEALIEAGARIATLEHVLSHGLARCVALRYKDARLAARAADLIYQRVDRTLGWMRRPIPYDFTMNTASYDKFFCSKLVRCAFDMASQGKVLLPAFMTRFDMKNRDFLDRIGVEAKESFAPGDLEIDPSFDVVAEWRDYRATSSLRMQDIVMDKFFAWMDDYGYTFKEDFVIRLIGVFGRMSSYLSERAKTAISDVVPSVPRYMTRSTIAAIAMLHKTAEPLAKELQALEEERIAATGQPLHPREVRDVLEQHRLASNGHIGYLIASPAK